MPASKQKRYRGLCAAVEHGNLPFDHTLEQKAAKYERRYVVTEKMRKQHPWLLCEPTESDICCSSCYSSIDRRGFIEHVIKKPRKPAVIDKQAELELKKQRLKIAAQDKLIAELLAKVERDQSTNPSEEHSSDIRNLDAAIAVDQINLCMIGDDNNDDFVETLR